MKANRYRGFTLVELLIVTLLLAIFLTLASVNWQVFSRKGGESFLESFSIEVTLLREEAISNYEERAIQFDLSTNSIYIGQPDRLKGFLQTRELKVPEPYVLRDVVLNGEKITCGKDHHAISLERHDRQGNPALLSRAKISSTLSSSTL